MVFHRDRSVTLVELIIAVTLVAVIILGINSINIFSHYQVISSERRAKIQNDVSRSLEHMTKHISRAIGDVSNDPVAYYIDNKGLRVKIDDNPANGRIDSADHWVGYRHEGNQILYFPSDPDGTHSLTSEAIASRILTTVASDPTDTWGLVINRIDANNLEIIVRARWDPAVSASQDNPEVSMQTSVNLPSVSSN